MNQLAIESSKKRVLHKQIEVNKLALDITQRLKGQNKAQKLTGKKGKKERKRETYRRSSN